MAFEDSHWNRLGRRNGQMMMGKFEELNHGDRKIHIEQEHLAE